MALDAYRDGAAVAWLPAPTRNAPIECLSCGKRRLAAVPPRPLSIQPCDVCGYVGWRYVTDQAHAALDFGDGRADDR